MSTIVPWTAVVPVKHTSAAKTRLTAIDRGLRARLALAFATDTVAALTRCEAVLAVLVVTDDPAVTARLAPTGVHVVPDEPRKGLNPALQHGRQAALRLHPDHAVAMVSADLPALRPRQLEQALAAAQASRPCFVSDAAGIGTTVLTCPPDVAVEAMFGRRSRARHSAAGYAELTLAGIPTVRRDVDTWVDLWDARRLGLGKETQRVLRER